MNSGGPSERPRAVPRPPVDPLLRRSGGLPLSAVLVRAGQSTVTSLATSVIRCQRELKVSGLTFWSFPGLSAEEVALRVRANVEAGWNPRTPPEPANPFVQSLLRFTSVEELLRCSDAFYLMKTGAMGHYTLRAPIDLGAKGGPMTRERILEGPDVFMLRRIEASLSEPRHNPAKGVIG